MAITYTNIIDAMIETEQQVEDIEKAVLTRDVYESFLMDDEFSEKMYDRQQETIGTEWEIKVEVGDENVLVTSDDQRVPIEQ